MKTLKARFRLKRNVMLVVQPRKSESHSLIRLLLLTYFVTLASGCGDDGGGVAGASWDSKKNLAEVDNYVGYTAPQVSETVFQNACHGRSADSWANISQHFDDIFRSFSFSVVRLEGSPVTLSDTGLVATFRNHELLVTKGGAVIIKETVPSVFVMHPMRAGVDKVNGTPVLMVANKSRASTGRYFVAVYSLDGTLLYKNVLSAGQVWDIARGEKHIDILGCGETRRITLQRPNMERDVTPSPSVPP